MGTILTASGEERSALITAAKERKAKAGLERAAKKDAARGLAEEEARYRALASAAFKNQTGVDTNGRDYASTDEAASALGLSAAQVRNAITRGDLAAEKVSIRTAYGSGEAWRVSLDSIAQQRKMDPAWLVAARKRRVPAIARARENEAERQAAAAAKRERLAEQYHIKEAERKAEEERHRSLIRVRLPLRRHQPSRVEVFLGPTNSGKTHHALRHLAERGGGTYAAPLRMLAYEAYERLGSLIGKDSVGLVTGEERLNENAPVICATAEMAPLNGELLVLDEVQWAADPERGWAWTRLLAGAEVDELYVTGEVGALPLVKAVLGEDAPVRFLDRLTPLEVVEKAVPIGQVPERSVVVAFSRKAVLHLGGLLRKQKRSIAVLYGALPPEVRREEIARFISGEAEICVATDVIGHGINLPVDTVVFAETNKFDGAVRRPLQAWEAAQIGGRAGRFGLSKQGRIMRLSGLAGFTADQRVIEAAANPRHGIGGHAAFREVCSGYVAPDLSDLGVEKSEELTDALNMWQDVARAWLKDMSWAIVSPVTLLVGRLDVLTRGQLSKTDRSPILSALSLDDAWALVRSPCDPDNSEDIDVLRTIGRCLVNSGAALSKFLDGTPEKWGAASLEAYARRLVILRWATLRFASRLDITHGAVVAKLDEVVKILNEALHRAVKDGVAHCSSCGEICAPWFSQCDSCHNQSYRDEWDDRWY